LGQAAARLGGRKKEAKVSNTIVLIIDGFFPDLISVPSFTNFDTYTDRPSLFRAVLTIFKRPLLGALGVMFAYGTLIMN
jgi:hypothetical protein